jgi:hypothetical protein
MRIPLSLRLALGLVLVLPMGRARADTEGWLIGESRLPVHQKRDGRHRLSLRMITDFRVAGRSQGLQQALMRIGMTWDAFDWLMLASQTTLATASNDGEKYLQEGRQELEATLSTPPGTRFSLTHRQRFELRLMPGRLWVRHRILQRFNLSPPSWKVHPYVWDELFIDSHEGINQNRLSVGLSWAARTNLRIEAGYIWRVRIDGPSGWVHDHGLRIGFSFIPSYEGEITRDGGNE